MSRGVNLMKTIKLSDFLAKNSQIEAKNTKKQPKSLKKEVIKMAIVVSFFMIFGADIMRIFITLIGLIISSIISLLNA